MPDAVLPRTVSRLDARIKIALLLAGSFATQYLPPAWLPFWLAALCLLYLHREMRTAEAYAMTRGAAIFSVVWLALLYIYLAWQAGGKPGAFLSALAFTGRLAAWALMGIAFTRLSPPVETGKAVTWFLRPFFGDKAWRAGLGLALVAWFLPLGLHLVADINGSLRMRRIILPWRKKIFLITGTALRLMEKKAWELALGIASRRLDSSQTWR